MTGFFAGDGAAANKQVEPSSLILQHFSGDDAVADLHEPAPPAAERLPHALVPANNVAAINPLPQGIRSAVMLVRSSCIKQAHLRPPGKDSNASGARRLRMLCCYSENKA